MALNRPSTGLMLIVLAAVVGALLVVLPGMLMERYRAAVDLGPAWGYLYLALVGTGLLILSTIAIRVAARIWRNTRLKRMQRERRARSPRDMSPQELEQELRDNLAAGLAYAEGRAVAPEVREAIRGNLAALESKLKSEKLEIVAFGTISSGKSSLLNALAGRELFRTDPVGGTTLRRSDVPWPGNDRVVLADTPGLAEVRGEARAAESAAAAKDADLVLFVVDGPLKAYEVDLLRRLAAMEKRVLVCLNKEDWFSREDRALLLEQIRRQLEPLVAEQDIVAVQARPAMRRRVRVLADGSEAEELVPVEPDIAPLAQRMTSLVQHGGRDLLLANLLLQSRGLVEESKERVRASLDKHAEELVGKYMWAAGGAAAVNPVPLLDIAGGGAVTVKMVLELARVYRQPIDVDAAVQLLGQLTKNLIAMLGVSAAAPAVTAVVAAIIKTVPGVGTIAGGLVQGLVQALITRWIGKVFIAYFRQGMTEPAEGLAELAREKWEEVTRPDQLLKLIQTGREQLARRTDSASRG